MRNIAESVLQLSGAGAYLKKAFCPESMLSQGLLVLACVILWLRHGLFLSYLWGRNQVRGVTESRTSILSISCGVPRALV